MIGHVHVPVTFIPVVDRRLESLVFIVRPRFYQCAICREPMYGVPA